MRDSGSHIEEKVQNALQNCSGGNFRNFIHKEFSGKITYYAILAIKVLVVEIIKLPTTTVLKGILNFLFH